MSPSLFVSAAVEASLDPVRADVAPVGLDDSLGPHLSCCDAHVRVDVAAVRWAPDTVSHAPAER
jgi:hypothetical protein